MTALPPSLRTRDGLQLHLQSWPCTAPARGSVLIVHGLGEHIGRYAHVAQQLHGWGWQVLGYDQRGHGRSEGARGRLNQADDLLHDLAGVIDTARATLPGPLVLLGHSMGGLVAARFVAGGIAPAEAWARPVEGLVLSSPALDPGLRAGQKLLLMLTTRLAPSLAVGNGLQPQWVSRDAQVVRNYIADPLVHDRVTPRLARFIVDGAAAVAARAADWAVPTLLLYAGSDRCVAPAGSAGFAAAAPQARVAAHEFRPLYHEIFNEPEQAEVFAVLREWLDALPAMAQTAAPRRPEDPR
jgi:alpha-beta hydrolase superfamily lysophospholipase